MATSNCNQPILLSPVRSSYKNTADFGAVLSGIVFAKRPLRRAAEYGILDGFSLDILERCSPPGAVIEGRDIFEEFCGNCPRRSVLDLRFGKSKKVKIMKGNFDDAEEELEDGAYDLIHIDVANTGVEYEVAERLMKKLARDGILLLEGGTEQRDCVPWMRDLNRAPMAPVIEKWRREGHLEVQVLGVFPGLTVVRNKEDPSHPS